MTLKTPVQTRSKLPDVGTTILPLSASFQPGITPSTFLRGAEFFLRPKTYFRRDPRHGGRA